MISKVILCLISRNEGRIVNFFYGYDAGITLSASANSQVRSMNDNIFSLTLSRPRLTSYRNQSIDLQRKSMDWFLYDIGLGRERVNDIIAVQFTSRAISSVSIFN